MANQFHPLKQDVSIPANSKIFEKLNQVNTGSSGLQKIDPTTAALPSLSDWGITPKGFEDKGSPYNEDAYGNGGVRPNVTQLLEILQQSNMNASNADSEKDTFNTYINYLMELERRSYQEDYSNRVREYDRALQLDERAYTSESAQLSRLMALGLSRSAALSYLQGASAGSNASSASSPTASVSGTTSTIAPSQTYKNTAETVGSVINSLSQLASLSFTGLSMPQVVAMNQISTNQALASNLQTQGIQDAGLFGSALFNSPVRPGYEDLVSLDALTSWAEKQTMDLNPAMAQFVNSDIYRRMKGNPFAYAAFNSMYNGYMDTKRWKEQEEDVLRISRMRQIEEKEAQIKYDSDFLNYQWQDVQFKDFSDRHEIINSYTMMEYKDKLDMLVASRTPEQLKFRIDKLKQDNEFAAISSWINLQTENYKKGMYQDSPAIQSLLYTSYLLNELGIDGVLGNSLKAAAFATTPVAMFADAAGGVVSDLAPKVGDAAKKGWNKGKQFFSDTSAWIQEQAERTFGWTKKKFNKHAYAIFPELEITR